MEQRSSAGRILWAMGKKNFLEFIRYPANAAFSLVMPLLWFLPTYLLIVSFAPDGVSPGLEAWIGESNFFTYLPIGLIVSYVIMTIFWNIGFALKRLMDIGMLETLWATPVPRMLFVVGESLFSMFRMAFELVLVMLVYRFVYGLTLPPGMFQILPYFIPFFVMMYGFGIVFAALVLLVKDANTMVDTSSFLVTALTGTQNPPQAFPRFIVAISLAIPITYFIDFIRVRTLGIEPLVSPAISVAVFSSAAILVPLLGLLFFSHVDRRARIRGDLHVH